MSRVGRPPSTEEKAEWKVHVPVSLAAQVELLLTDPVREKPKYGARNKLIEKLLREWLAKVKGDLAIARLDLIDSTDEKGEGDGRGQRSNSSQESD